MPTCSFCRAHHPDGVMICPHDGTPLLSGADGAMQDPGASAPTGEAALDVGKAPTLREMPAVARYVATAGGGATSPRSGAAATAAGGAVLANLEVPAPSDGDAPALAAGAGQAFDSMLGATLAGRYRIVRRIGEGGMGAVYEAVHTIIGKRVAVKVLLEKFLTKTDFVARLLQEARLASAIGNEHIVDVTDFGTTDDGRAFVAMEFLDGESLAQLIMREAPLPVERSLRLVRQVASALGAAHAKGIVHRDIKPENVYLIRRGEDDFVKVVDFGISKAVKQGQGLGDDVADYRLTHTGLLLGTPLYMSPEQARGEEDLDHRVDIWALGVMLYECLTGEVPFRANNYLSIISQVLTHIARSPSQLRPELGIPDAVDAVVMRAMEKDRTRRYGQMAEVEHDLERLLAGDQNVGSTPSPAATPNRTPPPQTDPGRGRIWIWGGAAAALVVGMVMALAHPREPQPPAATIAPAVTNAAPPRSAPAAVPLRVAPAVAPPARSGDSGGSAASRAVEKHPLGLDNRFAHVRVKRGGELGVRRLGTGAALAPGAVPARKSPGSEAALRGALPSRSGEGYPEN